MTTLKGNDVAILNYIFDPNITGKYDINYLDEEDNFSGPPDNDEPIEPRVLKARELELIAIKMADEGNLEEAINVFTQAIQVAERASGYNNRAQAYRLKGDDTIVDAMEDLEKALELSQSKGKAGCQALCQRGLIYRKLGATEKARADFHAAASLGSNFARKQLVEINPYAAMCNQMMKQILYPKNED